MAEHAGLIQVTTFQPAPGRRDELLALCAETQERAAAADGCFGAQTCTVEEDPDAVVAISRWRDRPSARQTPAAARASHRALRRPAPAAHVGGLGECAGVGDGPRGRREIGARQIDLIGAPSTASQPTRDWRADKADKAPPQRHPAGRADCSLLSRPRGAQRGEHSAGGAWASARRLVNGNVKMEFPGFEVSPINLPDCLTGSCREGGQPAQ